MPFWAGTTKTTAKQPAAFPGTTRAPPGVTVAEKRPSRLRPADKPCCAHQQRPSPIYALQFSARRRIHCLHIEWASAFNCAHEISHGERVAWVRIQLMCIYIISQHVCVRRITQSRPDSAVHLSTTAMRASPGQERNPRWCI